MVCNSEGRNKKVLVIEGDGTIQSAENLRRILAEALVDTDILVLDVSLTTEWDISGLQILCSAHKSALKKGKRITFEGKIHEHMIHVLRESGFFRHIGCNLDSTGECLWLDRGGM